MKAFILAAGLGSRLAPLTNNKPKALVEFNGRPMLQELIVRLKKQGFDQLLINIHHFGDKVLEFLEENNNFGIDISVSDERELLLDTGGAIVKAAGFFKGNEPVLVHNVDIYSNLEFSGLIKIHKESNALVTLAVRNRVTSRKLLFDERLRLTGWRNIKTGEYKWVDKQSAGYKERAYSGIYVASPDYPEQIKMSGSFPIVAQWLRLAKTNLIKGVEHNEGHWFDLGSVEKIAEAERFIAGLEG